MQSINNNYSALHASFIMKKEVFPGITYIKNDNHGCKFITTISVLVSLGLIDLYTSRHNIWSKKERTEERTEKQLYIVKAEFLGIIVKANLLCVQVH